MDDCSDLYPKMPKMTDSELSRKLREMNFDIGPVNTFTRSVYAHKLERLLLEQTSLEHVVTPGRTKPGKSEVAEDKDYEASPLSPGEMELTEDDIDISGGGAIIEDVEEEFLHSSPSLDAAAKSSKEKFGAVKTAKFSGRTAKLSTKEYDDVNAPSGSSRDKRKQLPTGHSESSGVLSSTLISGPVPKGALGLPNDASRVRQRTVLSSSDHSRDVKPYENCDRPELRPDDCIPSPRSPLQSYLQRIVASAPSRSDDPVTSSAPSAPGAAAQKPPEDPSWLNGIIALVMFIAILLLVLFVILNMEAGYSSPI